MANEYAEAMQCPGPPPVDKKIVGKMGLKGVKGLVYAVPTAQPQGPSRASASDNASKGKRARTNNLADGADGNMSASERNPKRGGAGDRDESSRPARRGHGRRRRGKGATDGGTS